MRAVSGPLTVAALLSGCATTPVGTACANHVSRGMTYEEVVSVLGQPTGGSTADYGSGKTYTVQWRSSSMGLLSTNLSMATVTFKDGKVQTLVCR